MMRFIALIMLLLFCGNYHLKAQQSSFGIQFGTLQYTGELAKESFRTKNLHGAFGLNYQKKISDAFDYRFQYSHGLIDYYQGETQNDTLEWQFATKLNSFEFNMVFKLNNGFILPKDFLIQPYLLLGMNLMISSANHYSEPWRLEYAIPFGWGINIEFNACWKAGIFSSFYYTFTDNLDGYDRSQQNLPDNLMDRFLYSGVLLQYVIKP